MRRPVTANVVFVVLLLGTAVIGERSWKLIADVTRVRGSVAALERPRTNEILDTEILDDRLYSFVLRDEMARQPDLLLFVASPPSIADVRTATSIVPDFVRISRDAGLLGEVLVVLPRAPSAVLDEVSVPAGGRLRVARDPDEFAFRTGIQLIPASFLVTSRRSVIAVKMSWPDVLWLQDSVSRFRAGQVHVQVAPISDGSGRELVSIRNLLKPPTPQR